MRGPDHKQSSLFSYTQIEDRIAADHPLRRIKVMADMVLHSMSPSFDSLYAEGGRPSIAPERLLRALLLQCLFSIRSERGLIEHLDFNMLFRWFVGLSQDEPVWDHSSFSANRDRLLKESVMREFFGGVVGIAEWAALISDEHFSVDGSLLRAWASHKSLAARDGSDEPPGPDALLATKNTGVAYLSYTTHTLSENRHGLIVDVRPPARPNGKRPKSCSSAGRRHVTRIAPSRWAPTGAMTWPSSSRRCRI